MTQNEDAVVDFAKQKGYKSSAEQIKTITAQLEQGVKDIFSSQKYREYLDVMSRFYNYSLNNCLLIAMQRPGATRVAGYQTWKNVNRQVRRGEKAIKIIMPCPYKKMKEVTETDNEGKTVRDASGDPVTVLKELNLMSFRVGSVFDVSQTEGDPLPEIASRLSGDVDGFDRILNALQDISPVPVRFGETGRANGYFSEKKNEIVIKKRMSQEQTIKSCVHEVAHSLLHAKGAEAENSDKRTREVQAESVAFVVCRRLGFESDQYSFGYIAGWSSGKETKELQASLELIQKTAATILSRIDEELQVQGKTK